MTCEARDVIVSNELRRAASRVPALYGALGIVVAIAAVGWMAAMALGSYAKSDALDAVEHRTTVLETDSRRTLDALKSIEAKLDKVIERGGIQ